LFPGRSRHGRQASHACRIFKSCGGTD
jgi:hypothetical protein